MRKQWKTGLSLLIAFSMLLSPMAGFGGSSVKTTASAATEESGESNTATEDTQVIYTDASTGYLFTVYDKKITVNKENTEENETSYLTMAEITGCIDNTRQELSFPAEVTIPNEESTVIPVGSIGESAFQENQAIISVTIPEGVEMIGYRAFYGCENLTSVSISSTIEKWQPKKDSISFLDNEAFKNCTALTNLQLADKLETLGYSSFMGCTALESITLPSHLNTFYDRTFQDCTGLKKLILPEGMTELGCLAFFGCTSLEEITIPSTITNFSRTKFQNLAATPHDCNAFKDCSSLKKVTFAEGLTTLEQSNLFSGDCHSLKSVTIPSSVKNISYAFSDCKYLEEIILPDNLEKIDDNAFSNCSSLKEIHIPSSVKEVGQYCFQGCSSITSITFPENMSCFSGNTSPFGGCTNLDSVYILSENIAYYMKLHSYKDNPFTIYCIKGSDTWNKYYKETPDTLAPIPEIDGISVTAYQGTYDRKAHTAFTLKGVQEGDTISYYQINPETGDKENTEVIPEITQPGNYEYIVIVKRNSEDTVCPIRCSYIEVSISIEKSPTTLILEDMSFSADSDYTLTPKEYNGDSTITYRYYRDAACTKRMSSKPVTPGTYYVVAVTTESDCYLAGKSNTATLVITEASENPVITPAPGATSSPGPNASPAPGTSPSPDASPSPGTSPDPDASPTPGNTPKPSPSGTTKPNLTPPPKNLQNQGNSSKQKIVVKKTIIKSAKSKRKKNALVQWKKVSGVTGYQIQFARNKKMTRNKKLITIKKAKTTKATIKKLKSRKKYYIRVRAYKVINKKKYYGKWSKIKTVKIK